ncbi:MAG: sensor domain-containing diguanylate cyclase [Sulfurimonadaceae bacterium]|jgi:diguanylate cyclase (GGDEF)-like protein/PAS domain S-box-containing protein|nr:sensor domain-containing diguanylate cyclase [Sulfurimonadaceae bacterium]
MIKIIDTKEFSHFLRVHRNEIIKRWLAKHEVQHILHKHSLPIIDKNSHILYEFCDCFIGVIETSSTISDCHIRLRFLELLNNYNISISELFTLVIRLKTTIEHIIFENKNLSFALTEEIETLTLSMVRELSETYESMRGDVKNYKSENANLLNEYKKAVDISNIVSKTNPKGVITYINDKFCEISGYTKEELIGKPHNIIRHPDMSREAFKELWDTIKAKKSWHGVVKNMKKNGGQYIVDTTVIPILDVDGDVTEYMAIRHDITELEETKEQLRNINKAMKSKVDELYSMTNSLEEKANRDNLTGIHNRDSFESLFSQEIKNAQNSKLPLSLVMFDIDKFKEINDTFGHQAGDNILVEIVHVIEKNIKQSDIFARWGGEEFVILLPNTAIEGAFSFAKKLREIVANHTFSYKETITASFGVAELDECDDKATLFHKTDKALYAAKANGRNRVEKSMFVCKN